MRTHVPMSEKEFQGWVVEVAGRFGWLVYHFHDSRREVRPGVHVGDALAAGFVDLVLVHQDKGRIVFAELKREGGRLTNAQTECLDAIRAVARVSIDGPTALAQGRAAPVIAAYAWWPGDRERIETILRTGVLL